MCIMTSDQHFIQWSGGWGRLGLGREEVEITEEAGT